LWRFYQGPYGDWHWVSIVDGVERCSRTGYASVDECVREARRRGLDAHHAIAVALALPLPFMAAARRKRCE